MKEGMPYCCNCFEGRFAEFCVTCGTQIGVDQGQMIHGDLHWHATAECFSCVTCNRALLGHPFLPKNGVAYCSFDCSRGANVHNESLADSANDSLRSGQSLTDRHSPKWNFEDPWIPRENHSEGYGSLQKHGQNYRSSLPDLSTCEEYVDIDANSRPPLPPKTRQTGSQHNLQHNRVTQPAKSKGKLPIGADKSKYVKSSRHSRSTTKDYENVITTQQKCVKWAYDQKDNILALEPNDCWPLSPIQGGDLAMRRLNSNPDMPKPNLKLSRSKATTSLKTETEKAQQRAAIASTSSLKTAEKTTPPCSRRLIPNLTPVVEEHSPLRATSLPPTAEHLGRNKPIMGILNKQREHSSHRQPSSTNSQQLQSPRKHRTKRMSRSQRERLAQRRCASPVEECVEDSSCSTCSSSSGDESELDDAYQADVIRNDGLRIAYADNMLVTPKKSITTRRSRKAKQHKTKNCNIQ